MKYHLFESILKLVSDESLNQSFWIVFNRRSFDRYVDWKKRKHKLNNCQSTYFTRQTNGPQITRSPLTGPAHAIWFDEGVFIDV